MRQGFRYIACILAAGMMSCVKEVPYKPIGPVPENPVLHLFISPDSSLVSSCWRVSGLLDKDRPEPGASMVLFRNGVNVATSTYAGNGIYQFGASTYRPGDSFRLSALLPGISPATVRGRLPNDVVITGVDTGRQLIPGVGRAFAMKLKFTDSAAYTNYYRVYLRKSYYQYVYDYQGVLVDSLYKQEVISVYSSELPAIENNYNNYTSREVLFSDATFNGVRNELLFYTADKLMRSRQSRPVAIDFYLENLDKPLYQYLNTRNAHIWQQQSISQIPGVLQGNVPGAFGVVGGLTVDKVHLLLK